jgi:hypothetical protein
MKVFSENVCFGIDNFFIGNIFNMLEFIEFLYFNLDIILEKYPDIFHQEFIFYYENNKYSYKSIKTSNKLNYEIPNKRITINKNKNKIIFDFTKEKWSKFI